MTRLNRWRHVVCLSVAAGVLLAAAACGRPTPQTLPASGRVTVGVTTTGPGTAGMTFTVSIEPAGIRGSIRADAGIFTAADAPAGHHVVRLTDLPGRCRVDGNAEREIDVSARRSATTRFVVTCS